MKELLRDLVALPGCGAFEQPVGRYIAERAGRRADGVQTDGLGNVIAWKQGGRPGPTVMLSAHMDEVGFMVRKIEPSGLLRFEKLGGNDDRVMLSEHVIVHTQNGPVQGVVGTISGHRLKFDDRTRVRPYRDLYIVIGASDRAEAEQMGVQLGDSVTWATPLQDLGPHRAMGHAFDDRAGCALLLATLEELDFSQLCGKVYFVFSTQEEVGLRGARVASQQIGADVALAVDTTPASDTPEPVNDGTVRLGGGPAIKAMDHSLIANVAVRRHLVALAKQLGLPYQIEIFPGIGTDAGEMHKEKAGVPTGVISIPFRYAHCPHEVIDWGDLDQCKQLLAAFLQSMEENTSFPG